MYILKIYIYFVVSDAICRLSTFILDSRLFYSRLSTFLLSTFDFFTLDSRLFSLDSRLVLSTLDFYSRLSTITLDSRHLLSTLDPRLLDTLKYLQFTDCENNQFLKKCILYNNYSKTRNLIGQYPCRMRQSCTGNLKVDIASHFTSLLRA